MDVHIGTLSKAVGSQGGFVACSVALKSLLLNRGRPYVFSTSLPLPSVAAAHEAVRVSIEVHHPPIVPYLQPGLFKIQVAQLPQEDCCSLLATNSTLSHSAVH